MPQRPIDVFYWPTPNGWKVTIALEEMGLPYTLVPVNIAVGDQFKPDFLKISPNNRMPAITDPDGPGGEPISVFESGAILQYLGRKTGQFYPADERGRAEVDQWLFWQMGGLGPMAGQAHHFRQYAPAMLDDPKLTEYGAERYTKEVNRLYGVMDRRLADRDYLAGAYSIADMACWPWIVPWQMQGQELDDFKNLRAWFERMRLRAPVQAGFKAGEELRKGGLGEKNDEAEKARKILFGQTSRN